MGVQTAIGPVLIEVIFVKDSQRIEITFHMETGVTNLTVANLTAAASAALTSAVTNFMPLCAPDTALAGVNVRTYNNLPNLSFQIPNLLPVFGTLTGNALPNNVTWAAKRLSGIQGRANRGRVYWPGLTDSVVTENAVDVLHAADVTTALSTFIGDIISATSWGPEIIYNLATNTSTDVVGYFPSDYVIDSQRRRLPGRGR